MGLKYLSDNLVRLRGPVNQQTNAAVSSGTCNAYLFHDKKDGFLASDVSSTSATFITVSHPELLTTTDTLIVQRDDGTYANCGLVTSVNKQTGVIGITSGIASGTAKKGNRVMVQLGAAVSMSTYGTPVVGKYDWGFQGTIQSSHGDLAPGVPVRIEIVMNSSGLVLTEFVRDTVSGGT